MGKTQMTMKNSIYQINFKDEQQDLLFVKVELYTDEPHQEGEIIDVSTGCSPVVAKMYIGNVVNLKDNTVGSNFNYAKPAEGFQVVTTKWIVESIVKEDDGNNNEEGEVPLSAGLQREDQGTA